MVDVFSKEKRSEVMSRIRGHGNRDTELAMIRVFRKHGIIGWRRHRPVFGKPDFVFPKYKLAVFVDGCFWHGCPQHYKSPATNGQFWEKKRKANKDRDKQVNKTLKEKGWSVVRIWEHELAVRSQSRLEKRIIDRIRQIVQA